MGRLIEERPAGVPEARETRRRSGAVRGAARRGVPVREALKGFGGRSVLEIVAPYRTDTYRTVYTVRFHGVIYVLHAFQKKSPTGIATPQQDMDLIRRRLAVAERDHREGQASP